MQNKNIVEILTYSIFKKEKFFYLGIPACNLENPLFLIENQSLIIKVNNCDYIIHNLPQYLIKSIKNNGCYLLENLVIYNSRKILIQI